MLVLALAICDLIDATEISIIDAFRLRVYFEGFNYGLNLLRRFTFKKTEMFFEDCKQKSFLVLMIESNIVHCIVKS